MELIGAIFDLFGQLLVAFFGAIRGVSYAPQNESWTRMRKLSLGLMLISMVLWITVFTITLADDVLFWSLVGSASLTMLGYLFLGNVCRRFYLETIKSG